MVDSAASKGKALDDIRPYIRPNAQDGFIRKVTETSHSTVKLSITADVKKWDSQVSIPNNEWTDADVFLLSSKNGFASVQSVRKPKPYAGFIRAW